MLRQFFKTTKQREVERRMAFRRGRMQIEKSVQSLAKQRERYHVMGRAAAANQSPEKVQLIARAIQQCNALERRMRSALNALDLWQQQQDIAGAQREFVIAMHDSRSTISEVHAPEALAEMDLSLREAESAKEEIELLTHAFMQGSRADESDAAERAALEAELNAAMREAPAPVSTQTATERAPAPARREPIEIDLSELERELNLAV